MRGACHWVPKDQFSAKEGIESLEVEVRQTEYKSSSRGVKSNTSIHLSEMKIKGVETYFSPQMSLKRA